MNRLKNEWLQLLLLLTPFCVAALLWDKLPERMPIHWNARGEVDGYAGKTFATLFVPLLNIGMVLIFILISLIDPRVRKSNPEARANFHNVFKTLRLAITGFLTIVALAVICIGAGYALDMSRIIGVSLALLFGVLGNFMGKIRPNYFVGVRTPWTLESPEVWTKTHRFTGRLMVGASVLLLIGCFLLPASMTVWLTTSVTLGVALIAVLYSYLAFRKQQPA